jgi:hypothetical protein
MGFVDTKSRFKLACHTCEQEVQHFHKGNNFAGQKLGPSALGFFVKNWRNMD